MKKKVWGNISWNETHGVNETFFRQIDLLRLGARNAFNFLINCKSKNVDSASAFQPIGSETKTTQMSNNTLNIVLRWFFFVLLLQLLSPSPKRFHGNHDKIRDMYPMSHGIKWEFIPRKLNSSKLSTFLFFRETIRVKKRN